MEPDVVEWDGGLKTLGTSMDYVKRHNHLYEPKGTWPSHDKVLGQPAKKEYLNRTYPEEPEHVSYYIPRGEDWDSNLKTLENDRPASGRPLSGPLTNWDKVCEQPRKTKDIHPNDSWNNDNFKVISRRRRQLVADTDGWNSNIKSLHNHGANMLPRSEKDRRRPLHHEDDWTGARKTLGVDARKPTKTSEYGNKLAHHEIGIDTWGTENVKTIAESKKSFLNRDPPGGKPKATGRKRHDRTWMSENMKVLAQSKPTGSPNDWSGTDKVLDQGRKSAARHNAEDGWVSGNKVVSEPYDRYRNYSVTNKTKDFHQGSPTPGVLPGTVE